MTDEATEEIRDELRAEGRATRQAFCRGCADEHGPCGGTDCASCYPFETEDETEDEE